MKVGWVITFTFVCFALAFITFVFGIFYEGYQDTFNCAETKTKYFRHEGTGGIFGGVRLVETTEDKHDVTKELCVRWNNE